MIRPNLKISDKKYNDAVSVESKSNKEYIFVLPPTQTAAIKKDFVFQAQDGTKLNTYLCFLGGGENTISIHYKIGRNAHVNTHVFFLAWGEQKLLLDEKFQFTETNSYGRFLTEGLVSQNARVSCVGNIIIDKDAQKTDSRLEMKSFLLGKNARSSMVPSLEIKANDVKAGHAATISQIDQEQLFYLRSRGVTKQQAMRLSLEGMFENFIKNISDKKKANELSEMVYSLYEKIIS